MTPFLYVALLACFGNSPVVAAVVDIAEIAGEHCAFACIFGIVTDMVVRVPHVLTFDWVLPSAYVDIA
jgi:hypothetical protein